MPTPPYQKTLLRENWEPLLERLTVYTGRKIERLSWRNTPKGLLPSGYDADGIAVEAISDLLTGKYPWLREGDSYTQEELWQELMRLASQRVKTLWSRAENDTTGRYDEPDKTGLSKGADQYPSDQPDPGKNAEQREAQAQLAEFRRSLAEFLGDEPLLAGIVECAFQGESRRAEIAQLLRVTPKQITNARKRLERCLVEYAQLHPEYPPILFQELAHA